jgi:hypothetical protein
MGRIGIFGDLGPWGTIPLRLKLGLAFIVVVAGGLGIATGADILSLAMAGLLLGLSFLAFVLVFDRRRPWWPPEPRLLVDPVGQAAMRNTVTAFAIIALVLAAVGLGLLRL